MKLSALVRPPLEGGKDSSKMHTDGRINLELAVGIALESLRASLG
jgi:hypothetical protein